MYVCMNWCINDRVIPQVPEAQSLLARALQIVRSLRACVNHLAGINWREEAGQREWGVAFAQAERLQVWNC